MKPDNRKSNQRFFDELKETGIQRCYLLEGEEEHVKEEALARLKKLILTGDFPDMNFAVLSDPDPDTLIAAAETVPFMADKRLILVKDCMMLGESKPREYDEDTAIGKLEAYLPNIPDTCCIVFFVRGKADGKKRFKKLLQKYASCYDFSEVDEQTLLKWTCKEANKRGKSIGTAACETLWFCSGRKLNLLLGEMEKIAAYTEGKDTITEDDVLAVATKTTEFKVFEMATALLNQRGEQAMSQYREMAAAKENPVTILPILGDQCRRILYAMQMKKNRMPDGTIIQKTGIPEFALRRTLQTGKRYTLEQLDQLCQWCYDTEFRIKSGQLTDESAFEGLLLRILSLGREGI